ncbi:MAG: MATE family efflux transporter [Bacteroidales bacterium]|nr:MATE family efflux transporter [Bacteroidales bacterium]
MEQLDRTKELETKDIRKLLWAYALPSIVSQIIASVYNICDRVFLGQCVGALAISGLAITMPIMNIVHAFGSLVGVGSSARMSIVLGKKDVNWAEKILGNSLLLTFFFGILFVTGGYVFMDRILTAFGASEETIGYAREYMDIVLPGMFFTTLTFNLTGLIRASGYPQKSMWIMVGGAVLNIGLDALFIYGLDWGIAGAAWATTISMAASGVAAVLHFIQPKSFIRFRRHAWRPKGYIFRNILLIGMSPFLMNVAASGVVALLNRQLIHYGGDLAVGAYGIINTFGSLAVMLILGVCQGMQPIAGYNYGAGHPLRLKAVYTLTMKVNVTIGMVSAILALTIPQILLRAFTREQELIDIAVPGMRFMLVMFALVGFTITNSNFFQSIDKPWIAIVTSLSRQVLFLAPMIYIVPPVFERLGLDGIFAYWMISGISDSFGMFVTSIMTFIKQLLGITGDGLTGVWASLTISDVLGAALAFVLMLTQRKVFRPAE